LLRFLLKASQARNKARLAELQGKVEKGEVRSEELAAVKAEVEALTKEAKTFADEIAKLEAEEKEEDSDKKKDDDLEKKEDPATKENPNEKTELSEEQRSAISASIAAALSTKGHRANKETEIRSVFANYIVGNIDEKEARALGLVTGNGRFPFSRNTR
ncbi:phage major capsid protein, partial [Bacillus sp. HC-Mk]